jgi:hypothetical protein
MPNRHREEQRRIYYMAQDTWEEAESTLNPSSAIFKVQA